MNGMKRWVTITTDVASMRSAVARLIEGIMLTDKCACNAELMKWSHLVEPGPNLCGDVKDGRVWVRRLVALCGGWRCGVGCCSSQADGQKVTQRMSPRGLQYAAQGVQLGDHRDVIQIVS